MSDLWTEASRDIEADDEARLLVHARLAAAPVLPFLRAAKSLPDFDQRVSLAEDRLLATAGAHAAQIVAEVRTEVAARPAPEPVRKRSFRIEADSAGGGYYVVDEETGQDVGGAYPDQSAAEQAAAGNPELEVSHTPTGNPDAPGLTADAPGPVGDSPTATPPMDPAGNTAPVAPAPAPDGPPDAAPLNEASVPIGAPSGSGDATDDPDAESKTSARTFEHLGFKVALQEGEDPLFPLFQLLDQGQGQAEQPSYHTDSQQQLGAPSGHANGEIGTKDPEGDLMSAPDAKSPYKAAAKGGGNPFARSATFFDNPTPGQQIARERHQDAHDTALRPHEPGFDLKSAISDRHDGNQSAWHQKTFDHVAGWEHGDPAMAHHPEHGVKEGDYVAHADHDRFTGGYDYSHGYANKKPILLDKGRPASNPHGTWISTSGADNDGQPNTRSGHSSPVHCNVLEWRKNPKNHGEPDPHKIGSESPFKPAMTEHLQNSKSGPTRRQKEQVQRQKDDAEAAAAHTMRSQHGAEFGLR